MRSGPFPKVHLLHGNLTSEEVASLYHHPKVFGFISATRGEGYGLPLVDAAASGVPVLATNWSGHLEFLKAGLFTAVDYQLKNIPKNKIDNRIFFEGTKWAEVNEQDFKSKLRGLYNNIETPKSNAAELKEIVQEKFSKKELKVLNQKLIALEKSFISEKGMYFGSWYKSLYASSDPFSGYAAWILPGLEYEIALMKKDRLEEWDSRYSKAISSLGRKMEELIKLLN